MLERINTDYEDGCTCSFTYTCYVGWMDGWMDRRKEGRKEGNFVVLYKALAKWLCQG